MNLFERYLTLWVFLCIVAGIGLGHFFAGAFQAIGSMEIAKVNLPVAVPALPVRGAVKNKGPERGLCSPAGGCTGSSNALYSECPAQRSDDPDQSRPE